MIRPPSHTYTGPFPSLQLISCALFSRFRASGGKSGVHFYKTNDDRFLLKELSRQEAKDFNVFAHKYLNYIREARDKNQPTLLAKIVGKNADTNLLLKTDTSAFRTGNGNDCF